MDEGCNPQTVEECNLATTAAMTELMDQMRFRSKTLIDGQEDILTLTEYEALFEADMRICEDTLDIVLDLAKKRKAHLEALIAVKRLETQLSLSISDALKRASDKAQLADDLRKKVREGDYSFFVPGLEKGDKTSAVSPISVMSSLDNICQARLFSSDLSAVSSNPVPRNTVLSSLPAAGISSSSFQIRKRPQYSSEAARRVLGELGSVATDNEEPSAAEKVEKKTERRHKELHSMDRLHQDGRAYKKQLSASGGCSLDGSVIVDNGEISDQNGLRPYSPVTEVPPQPNFDETGMESFSEPIRLSLGPSTSTKARDAADRENKTVPDSLVLKSSENVPATQLDADAKKPVPEADRPWLSSAYKVRARPKFTSSIGRMFNKE